MSGPAVVGMLALGLGSAAIGIRLVWELHRETNGDGKIETARRCLLRAKHEAGQMRAELKKLEPGEGGRTP